MTRIWIGVAVLLALTAPVRAEEEIRMASGPDLSPDGRTIVFSWRGDLWTVSSEGGTARRLTTHPALEYEARFSPDGTEIAFRSDRFPGGQVFVMPAGGGAARQITFDTSGYSLQGWFPDGDHVLVRGRSDRFWVDDYRLYRISTTERRAPEMLFDAYAVYGEVSPDGGRILFTREGVAWWRKGYTGSQASQIWLYDLDAKSFRAVVRGETGARYPIWAPGPGAGYAYGEGSFLYVGGGTGSFNLYNAPAEGPHVRLTQYADDSVISPTVARNANVVVFRHLFDLYRLDLDRPGEGPRKLRITAAGDDATPERERLEIKSATRAAFTADGLEIAMIAGGDLWVMDTMLKEPVRVAATAEEEREPWFTPDGSAILFLSDQQGQSDIWRAERADASKYWWQNDSFRITRITDDPAYEQSLSSSPDGKRIAFVRGLGSLVTAKADGSEEQVLVRASTAPGYSWSPDGRWLAYAYDDADSNRDIWIAPADGSAPAVNVSRHPYDDWNPAWSPDGRILAFLGARRDGESDIFYVYLRESDEEETSRERTLERAVAKMRKARPPAGGKKPGKKPAVEGEPPPPDFGTIHERVRRLRNPNVAEGGLFWSPDGKKLAFSASLDGRRGTYTVTFPDGLRPSFMTGTIGGAPRWVKAGNQILWLVSGAPASSVGAKTTSYGFRAQVVRDRRAHQRAAFDLAWRSIRDWFYDGRFNNRDWDVIRGKYREAATSAPDRSTFGRIVSLMLGELNASHMGFSVRGGTTWRAPGQWDVVTGDLGLRFDAAHPGPGLLVSEVVPDGPADSADDPVRAGEVLLEVDGAPVRPGMDLTEVLNGPAGRELRLTLSSGSGKRRELSVRPTTLSTIRRMLRYRQWLKTTRKQVAELSGEKLGYVHVRGMEWSSFEAFEKAIYSEGYGRKGLIIDVRENGGGFTADHLLTILFQPEHALTVRRDAEPGYPQDRLIYTKWNRPIVVLVNQSSFSNAEIFGHAVKTLKRGQVVGVPSAGGVISTSARRVLDMGTIRTPLRGWFLIDSGEDLERNGVVPHHVVWPEPGEMPAGKDRQLEKAVEVLLRDVAAWEARPRPKLRKASER